MNRAAIIGTLCLLLVLLLPPASQAQATAEPVPGVSAFVLDWTGSMTVIQLRWYESPNDPSHSFTYNITTSTNNDVWVNQGANGQLQSDGFWQFIYEASGSGAWTVEFNITADDGTGPVDSCTVTVVQGTKYDFDACGLMDPGNMQEYFCLPTTLDSTGFNYQRNLRIASTTQVDFQTSPGGSLKRLSIGALNLGGDVTTLGLSTRVRFASDGFSSEARIMISSVDIQVSELAFGDGETTAAMSDGYEIRLTENGNDVGLSMERHTNGGRVNIMTKDSDFLPSNANFWNDLTFIIHPPSDTIQVSIGGSTAIRSMFQQGIAPWKSIWISEGWESASTSYWGGSTDWCLTTDAENPNVPGLATSGNLEDFDGQGGFIGNASFPGIDIGVEANRLGIEERGLAWILAFIMLLACIGGGYAVGRSVGAAVIGAMGVVANVFLGLMPLWLVVLIWLLAMTVIILLGSRR